MVSVWKRSRRIETEMTQCAIHSIVPMRQKTTVEFTNSEWSGGLEKVRSRRWSVDGEMEEAESWRHGLRRVRKSET